MTYSNIFKEWATVLVAILAASLLSVAAFTTGAGGLLQREGKSNMPATIAETVFITNDGEARDLSEGTGERQQEIAEALRTGIEHYLRTH
jgi:hypothetical protein